MGKRRGWGRGEQVGGEGGVAPFGLGLAGSGRPPPPAGQSSSPRVAGPARPPESPSSRRRSPSSPCAQVSAAPARHEPAPPEVLAGVRGRPRARIPRGVAPPAPGHAEQGDPTPDPDRLGGAPSGSPTPRVARWSRAPLRPQIPGAPPGPEPRPRLRRPRGPPTQVPGDRRSRSPGAELAGTGCGAPRGRREGFWPGAAARLRPRGLQGWRTVRDPAPSDARRAFLKVEEEERDSLGRLWRARSPGNGHIFVGKSRSRAGSPQHHCPGRLAAPPQHTHRELHHLVSKHCW